MWLGTGPEQSECQAWIHTASTREDSGFSGSYPDNGGRGCPARTAGDAKSRIAAGKGGEKNFHVTAETVRTRVAPLKNRAV